MVVDTQFHKFYGRPFGRVLYLFLIKYVGRWLPWVLPGSTGRFYKDDVPQPFCARILYNPHGGRGKICMILLLHVKQNKTKLSKNCHPHNNTVRYLDPRLHFIWKTIWCVMRRAKSMYVYDVKTPKLQVRGTPCKCCKQVTAEVQPRLVSISRSWMQRSSFRRLNILCVSVQCLLSTVNTRSPLPKAFKSM